MSPEVDVRQIFNSPKVAKQIDLKAQSSFNNFDLRKYGITRVADHTGLDEIGIPVWAAMRPDARSVSQCNGKGLTHDQARISAVMEGIETALAETAERKIATIASIAEMRAADLPIANFEMMLKCNDKISDPATNWRWIRGIGLATGGECFAPLGLVSLDLRQDVNPDFADFHLSSVGLAAHFKREDAILHGLLEAIEYDALAQVMAWPGILDACPHLNGIQGVSDALDQAIDACRAVHLDPVFQLLATDISLPVVVCRLRDSAPRSAPRRTRPFSGHACRLDMVDAAIAALLEAVQSRMTDISGAREDIADGDYEMTDTPPRLLIGHKSVALVHSPKHLTSKQSIKFILRRFAEISLAEPLVFDLHDESDPLFCVAVHCPGLETGTTQDGYRSGRRAEFRIIKHGLGFA